LRTKIRPTALFLIVACICQTPSLLYAEALSFPAPSVKPLALNQDLSFALPDIAPEWGKIQEIFIAHSPKHSKNPSREFLFLIQDAHGNLSAQESIYQIISELLNALPEKPVVLLEGAAGEVNTSLLSKYPDSETKIRVAKRLFEEGQIDGVERFNIIEKPDLKLIGIENPSSYQENLKAAFAVFPKQEEVLGHLAALDKTMAGLMPYVCEPELAEILDRIEKNRETSSAFPDYLGWLHSKAILHGIGLGDFSELSALFSIESKGDFECLLKTLDQRALFAEIERVEDNVLVKVTHNAKEKTFVRLFKHLRLLQRAVALNLKPSEAEYFLKFTNEFRVSVFLDFIEREKGKQAAEQLRSGTKSDALLPEIARFYQAARRRDSDMKEKIVQRISEEHAPSAIVVTGGFHTPGMAHFLREENISYAVITPAFEQTSDFGLYKRNLLKFLSVDSQTLHLPRMFDEDIQMLIPPAEQLYVDQFRRRLKFELPMAGVGFGAEPEPVNGDAIPELPEQVRSWSVFIENATRAIIDAKQLEFELAREHEPDEEALASQDAAYLKSQRGEVLGEAVESLQEAFEGEELTKLQVALDGYFAQLEQAAKDFKNGKKTYEEVSRTIFPIETLVQQAVHEFDYLESALIDSPMDALWLRMIKAWKPKANSVLESIKIRWFTFYKSLADHSLRRFSSVLRFLHENPGFHRLLQEVAEHGYPSDEISRKRIEQYLDLLQVEQTKFEDLLRLMKKDPSLDPNTLPQELLKDSYVFIGKADEFLMSALGISSAEGKGLQSASAMDDKSYQGRAMELASLYSIWANEREWLTDEKTQEEVRLAREKSETVLDIFRYKADTIFPLQATLDMSDMAHAKGRINQALQHLQEFLHIPSAKRLVKDSETASALRNFLGPLAVIRFLLIHADRSRNELSAKLDEAIRHQFDPEKITGDDLAQLLATLGTTDSPQLGQKRKALTKERAQRLTLIGIEKGAFLDILDQALLEASEEFGGGKSSYYLSTKNFIERLEELEGLRKHLKAGKLISEGKKNTFDIFDALFPKKPILTGNWTPRDQGIAELATIYYSGILFWDGTSAGGEKLESGTKKIHRALGHIINRGLLYETNRFQLRQQMVTMRRIKDRIRNDGAIKSLNLNAKEMEFLEQILRKALIPLPDLWFEQVRSLAIRKNSLGEEQLLDELRQLFNEDNRIFIERVVFSAFSDLEAGGIKPVEERELLSGARKRIELLLGTLHAITGVERPAVRMDGPQIATRDSAVDALIASLAVLDLAKFRQSRPALELQRRALAWLEDIYVQASRYYAIRAHQELRSFESKKENPVPYKNAEVALELAKSRLEKAMEIGERGQEIEGELLTLEKVAGDAKKGLPSVKNFDYSALSLQLSREYLYQRRLVRFRADLDRKESEQEKRDIVKRALETWRKIGRLDREHPLTTQLRAVDEAFIPFDLRNAAIQVLDEILIEASIERDIDIIRKTMIRFLILERMGPEASAIADQLDGAIVEIQAIRDKWQQEQIRKEKVREKEVEMQEILKKAEENPRLNEFVDKIIEEGHRFAALAVKLQQEGRKIEVADIFPSAPMFDGFIDDGRRASILTIALAHWTEALAKGRHPLTDKELTFILSRGLFFENRELHKDVVPPDELKKIAKAEPMHVTEMGDEMDFYDKLMEEGGLYPPSGFGSKQAVLDRLANQLQTIYSGSAFAGERIDANLALEKLSNGFGYLQNFTHSQSSTPKAIVTGFESLPSDFLVIQKFLGQNGRWVIVFRGTSEEAAVRFKRSFNLDKVPSGIEFVSYSDTRQLSNAFSPLLRQLIEADRIRFENVLVFFGPELEFALKKFSSLALRVYDAPGSIEELKWQTILALINLGPNHPAVKDFLALDGGFLRVVTMEELADRLAASGQFAVAA